MKPMIDHEELERVKKLEDVEWLKSKKVYYLEFSINLDDKSAQVNVFVYKKGKADCERIYGKNLFSCKLQAMDFLEGISK